MTFEQKVAVRRRQWGAAGRSGPLAIHLIPSMYKTFPGRRGIFATLAACISYGISTILQDFTVSPHAGLGVHMATIPFLAVVTFLTFSALMFLLARQVGLPRFRDHFRHVGVFNSSVDVFLGVVNWLYVSLRPKKVKESPVIAKAAEEVDWETILCPGDRRLKRDFRCSADRRRRIAVR